MDTYDAQVRSAVMRAVKSRNTKPELIVRRLLHAAGFRYRIHRNDLPGKPDLVFPARKKAIFINGCLWHQHPGCRAANRPVTNRQYWDAKLDRNVARDAANLAALTRAGWAVYTVWECETRDPAALFAKISSFLEGDPIRE